MKKLDKKAFTLIELIVVVAVVGILVLLGMPRFIGHKDKAELARIQHDVKVMEQEIGTVLINNDDDFNNWENNNKDFNQLIQENRLFEKEGVAKKVESIDKTYKIIPEKYKDNINTKLKGTFYANDDGKVYYEHEKPLLGIPIKPEEKKPEYSDEEIDNLVKIDYIPVATAEELNSIRINEERTYGKGTQWEGEYTGGLDKRYIQVANLDLSEYSEEGWNPIGTLDLSSTSELFGDNFTGTYDGGNYVITGLGVKGKDFQGLFGITLGATIRNVALEDIKVTGANQVGGLVGGAINTTISNSYATGSVTGSEARVGGLVGTVESNNYISNSYFTGSVTGSGVVGGLVGYVGMNNYINNSYATGEVKSSGTGTWELSNAGGLVGFAHDSTISNSYATGSVEGRDYVGGLVGYAEYNPIENSYATGSVEGVSRVGGLVGEASWDSNISNSYATGSVKGTEYVGGLVGRNYNNTSTVTSSYWDTQTTGQSNSSGGNGGEKGKTTEEMKKADTYSAWGTDVWNIVNGEYPTLR